MGNVITYRDELDAQQALVNDQLCKKIGGHVAKKYPDRKWMVEVTDSGRICRLRLPQISMDYGMQFKIMDLMEFNYKKAERFAGEMLERFNLTRGRSDNYDMMSLHKNIKGEAVGAKHGDISENKPRTQAVSLVDSTGRAMTGVKFND